MGVLGFDGASGVKRGVWGIKGCLWGVIVFVF